ncbi:hypothetical protein Droror1_Dr00007896 [Drosera rotundifolia]
MLMIESDQIVVYPKHQSWGKETRKSEANVDVAMSPLLLSLSNIVGPKIRHSAQTHGPNLLDINCTHSLHHHLLSQLETLVYSRRFPAADHRNQGKMQNEEGQIMDLYIPRKCSATNRLITAKDHASVQINIGHLDENGVYNNTFSTFALSGFVRAQGDADSALDRLWQKKKAELRQ